MNLTWTLILVLIVLNLCFVIAWMISMQLLSDNFKTKFPDPSLPLLHAASLAESGLERERAVVIREIPQLAQNAEVRQMLRVRRRSLNSPEIVTHAEALRTSRIETAALVYDRFPFVIIRQTSAMRLNHLLNDSVTLDAGKRNDQSWAVLREPEGVFIGGIGLRDLADSCYLVVAMRADSVLLSRKQHIEAARSQWAELRTDSTPWTSLMPVLIGVGLLIIGGLTILRLLFLVRNDLTYLQLSLNKTESFDLDYRIVEHPHVTEFTPIYKAYNKMAEELTTRQHRLMYLEKVSAWREIAQRMAHEIKNPLTPIQLTTEQLRDSYKGDDDKFRKLLAQSAEMILEEIDNLRILTKEFSEFARLPSLKFQQLNFTDLITETVRMYGTTPITMELTQEVGLEGDGDAMKRVLVNLIENARHAISGQQDGRIHIRLTDDLDVVLLDVADNGIGIPQAHLGKIFHPYFGTNAAGMGLGLAIVKSIVEEHRGTIVVDSVEKRGTTFHLRMPKKVQLFNGKESP